jgi:hypothetical protein
MSENAASMAAAMSGSHVCAYVGAAFTTSDDVVGLKRIVDRRRTTADPADSLF